MAVQDSRGRKDVGIADLRRISSAQNVLPFVSQLQFSAEPPYL
jgi:hypothetical protein